MKLLIAICACVLLSGCSTLRFKGSVQEVKVPLLYCPAPPDYLRPDLEIHNLTNEELNSPGKVVQAYSASMIQLLAYTQELEKSLQFYQDANTSFQDLETRLRNFSPPEAVTE